MGKTSWQHDTRTSPSLPTQSSSMAIIIVHTHRENRIHSAPSSFTPVCSYCADSAKHLHRSAFSSPWWLDLSFGYPLCRIRFRAKSAQDMFSLRSWIPFSSLCMLGNTLMNTLRGPCSSRCKNGWLVLGSILELCVHIDSFPDPQSSGQCTQLESLGMRLGYVILPSWYNMVTCDSMLPYKVTCAQMWAMCTIWNTSVVCVCKYGGWHFLCPCEGFICYKLTKLGDIPPLSTWWEGR